MKRGKRHMTERIELRNQERIRTLGEKETYKYLGILEADTIKQVELKEKNLKIVSQENEKTTRNQTVQQESHRRDKHLGCFLVRYSGLFFEVDVEKT